MESGKADREGATYEGGHTARRQGGYPMNHVVGVINSAEEAVRTVQALTTGGFLETEIQVAAGEAEADAMHQRTGRSGLTNLLIRIADRVGLTDEEMEVKAQYEQALRDGHVVLFVAAPTEARKARAVEILREHGAHTVHFLGRFAQTQFVAPEPPEPGA